MAFSRGQADALLLVVVFRLIISSVVAVCILAQADQFLYQGRHTAATLDVLQRVSIALGLR